MLSQENGNYQASDSPTGWFIGVSSSSLGRISISLEIIEYFVTKYVNLLHKWVSFSNASNIDLWWKYAWENIL